ncbi:MAG: choice-of-anchor B family protein [Phycisphaerales bacterium]|nr:choice-of-anchor B family protein [Phycisphaerales bacterium]
MLVKTNGRLVAAATVTLTAISTVMAHQDDPKAKDTHEPYVGPGYRAATDGGDPGFPADGVVLLSWIPIAEFGGGSGSANDSWGYTSPSGREYAIIGLECGTGFADITQPDNAQVVGMIPGTCCTWRDIKTFGEYAYVVTECGDGMQIVDLTNIDSGTVALANSVTVGGSDSHNIALNTDSGYAYRTGGDQYGLGIYDLNVDQVNPPLVAVWEERYVHDAQIITYDSGPYAGREIAFCCSGFSSGGVETGIDILDVTDKSDIINLARYQYSNGVYSHQAWLSDDRQYFYLGDELDEGDLGITTETKVIDVSDIENPIEVAIFTNGSPAIGHNMYVRDGLIFQANYSSGLRIFETSDPIAPTEIAYFDTHPDDDATDYGGMWSNYPFFASGVVIASDRQRGLFVLSVEEPLVEFAFPTPLPDTIPSSGATVQIEIAELEPGAVVDGSQTLFYEVGEDFVAQSLVSIGGDLYEGTLPGDICPTEMRYYFSVETSEGDIVTSPTSAPALATYSVTVADGFVVALMDDMETDPGWSVENIDLTDGAWERGVPAGDGDRGDPTVDADGSGQCWLTDNAAGNTDVDGGPTMLISQTIDLTGIDDPWVSYARWFSNNDLDEDRLDVHVSSDDGGSWTLVDSFPDFSGWKVSTHRIADFVTPTSTFRIRFSATDNPNNSVTEAAIDALEIFSFVCEDDVPGDTDGDGDVDFADLLTTLSSWGPCPPPPADCPADFDGSGVVDFVDLLTVLSNWS